jgi:hypothetical protein
MISIPGCRASACPFLRWGSFTFRVADGF